MNQQQISLEDVEKIQGIVTGLLTSMGFEARLEAEQTLTKGLVLNIDIGSESYLLIGKLGANLHALESLAHSMAAKQMEGRFVRFSLDVDDYKRKREWYLKETVRHALEKAKTSGRPVALSPMPNYERRFVHSLIAEMEPTAISSSTGQDPRRRVVIKFS